MAGTSRSSAVGKPPPHEAVGKPGAFFNRWRRIWDDSFPASSRRTTPCVFQASRNLSVRGSVHPGARGTACRWSGPDQVGEHAGRNEPSPSFAMSSDRLFLDRGARQHCPSPLHRQAQTERHFSRASAKRGHFYFASTHRKTVLTNKSRRTIVQVGRYF